MREPPDDLLRALAAVDPRWRLRVNSNRATLLSLRWQGNTGTISVHHQLLADSAFCAALPAWVAAGGRKRMPAIEATVEREAGRLFHARSAAARASLPDYERLGGPCDLDAMFTRIHRGWFSHLTAPSLGWGRAVAPGRRLTHIRFGVYQSGKRPRILLHPRLDQPWVARIFVEHVIFHELCHHAQVSRPLRGEPHHSPRFREWEQRYPQHQQAIAWEEAYLPYLLSGQTPIGH